MKRYTVSQLAQMANISVRTLHHYDEIGLLKPAATGENRYRYYGESELLRLMQILIYREMEMPLAEIGAMLDAPGLDRIEALQRQRGQLAEKAAHCARMIETIDRTIAGLKGEHEMKDTDLYSGIVSPQKQAEHEAWLVERYGKEMKDAIDDSLKWPDRPETERKALMDELRSIESDLAGAMRDGIPPQAAALDPLLERHRAWVSANWRRACTPQAYAGLADIYQHEDFRARFEAIENGFADYLIAAMRSWARRHAEA